MAEYPPFLKELLNSCPHAKDGVHPWLFRVARYLHHYHTPDEILTILQERIANCGRYIEPHEIPDAIKNSGAYKWEPKTASQRRAEWIANPDTTRPRAVPDFNPERARVAAAKIPVPITEGWLKAHSPVCVNCSVTEFVEMLFGPNEKLLVFTNFRSQGYLSPDECDVEQFASADFADGVWFLCNPVDGHFHYNPRLQKQSRRSEESITSFRYAVLECDREPREVWRPVWLAILAGLSLPIVAITNSGGRSDHALIRVSADSKANWDRYKLDHLRPLAELGADDGALSAVRLTRLPGCLRAGTRQELLYLNPAADGTPIFSK